jgi:hypothetical protein
VSSLDPIARDAPGRAAEPVRRRVYRHLDTTHVTSRRVSAINVLLMWLVVANIAALIAESLPGAAAFDWPAREPLTFEGAAVNLRCTLGGRGHVHRHRTRAPPP